MEIFDSNVIKWGFKSNVESVADVETIHERMVQLDIKLALSGPYSMPHYRGEQKFGWDLTPNLLRIPNLSDNKAKAKELEKNGWLEFEKVIKEKFGIDALRTIFDNESHGKDWNLLMQAQHAFIKTSLLDWSPNVYAPLYFATEKSTDIDIENSDGQFWVFMTPFESVKSHTDFPIRDSFYDQDPQKLKEGSMINVSILLDNLSERKYELRMFRQKGRFYISGDNQWGVPMNRQINIAPLLFRFNVPSQNKITIRRELEIRGIDYEYLYSPVNADHQKLIDDINKKIFGL